MKIFQKIVSYLKDLGITTVYASPVFEAVPGSPHGYDVLNPHKVNPEIGDETQWLEIIGKLKEYGIGWLQDIVPNHMAFDSRNNWLMDTLEKGKRSCYASFFDIDRTSDVYEGRVMVPFLGAPLQQAIQNGELKIEYQNERFVFRYYDTSYPLNPRSYITVLSNCVEDISTLTTQIKKLEKIEDPDLYETEWNKCIHDITSASTPENIRDCIDILNENKDLLLQIANDQHYSLVHWQETDSRINYRRFFTVNGLICLNMHKPEVFEHFHTYINSLIKRAVTDGIRIDHIDGLYDPAFYLNQLREMAGQEVYIVVEKILASTEQLPGEWPVQGTTGYDFLTVVNNLLTNKNAHTDFANFYKQLVHDDMGISQQIREKKAYMLYHHMGGELENLFRLFMQLTNKESYAAMRTEDIKTAIAEFLIHCPVYRFYGHVLPFTETESDSIRNVFNSMLITRPDLSAAISLLGKVLLQETYGNKTEWNERVLHFYKRCMQFSGPLMAKGVEDTLMYSYNSFIGHNEVGDSPEAFGCSINEFHELMKKRLHNWPLTLNTTSTHDTKKGEDVRARLNVLTDLPKEWIAKVEEWRAINASSVEDNKPDANDEYFIYQTLVGSYPVNENDEDYSIRLNEYLQKALREAKRHSNWTSPNKEYEETTKRFAVGLLDKDKPFWKSFAPFQRQVADFGIINSLVQVILKFTCPGVPDTYQGTELWDLSLVDPDNRRPVDYNLRKSILARLKDGDNNNKLIEDLWQSRFDGRVKLWLIHHLLNLRSKNRNLFAEGSYMPLKTRGRLKDHVLAFARVVGNEAVIVVVPLQITSICISQNTDARSMDWKDTRVVVPPRFTGDFTNIFTNVDGKAGSGLSVQKIFAKLPFAVIETSLRENERNSGILLHISSLTSPYGIGDIGPEAKAFADFLVRTGQKYWQLLPVNPTEAGQGHSPYSAVSSRGGNILLISPDILFSQGLLSEDDLTESRIDSSTKTDYANAERIKKDLLNRAWRNFVNATDDHLQKSYETFCNAEREWLDDFALYMLLKQINEGKPWYEWEEEYKFSRKDTLKNLSEENMEALSEIKWHQFTFYQQWNDLKKYCNSHGILLIGDLPFYISYDSADVWSHRELFSLDEEGNRIGVAGVPPDFFSADGQLWGMPVFRWDVLKEQGYSWWIDRLKSNRKLFDLVRLDHFRAFAGYWEVPSIESTARNGEWKPGPGADFFQKVKEEFGELPFIAEDLGDIDETVLNLRDEFNLPGMKVLQFAFGDDDFYESEYIPHNYEHNFIVYTGTHDNNTTVGWFRTEIDDDVKQRVRKYIGKHLTDADIAPAFCRMAMASIAKTVIIPMQDIL